MVPINLALKASPGRASPSTAGHVDMRADSVPLDLASRFTDAISQSTATRSGTATRARPAQEAPSIDGDLALASSDRRA